MIQNHFKKIITIVFLSSPTNEPNNKIIVGYFVVDATYESKQISCIHN
jgi:hypothetical protein